MNFAGAMTFRYILALTVLAAIALTSDYMLVKRIRAEQGQSAEVNIAGRQRLLVQKMAFCALQIVAADKPGEREQARQELRHAMDVLNICVDGLLNGNAALNLPGNPAPEIRAIYYEPPHHLQQQLRVFTAAAEALLRDEVATWTQSNAHLHYLVDNTARLLQPLDLVVSLYQREGEQAIVELQRLERTMLAITMGVLVLMALFIFRPMVERIREHLQERELAAQERERLIAELRDALARVKTLRGLIPICAECKKIRDDRGYWNLLEDYLGRHSDADFTHGFCPDCQRRFEEDG